MIKFRGGKEGMVKEINEIERKSNMVKRERRKEMKLEKNKWKENVKI